ncbi:MAG: tyrosine-protein phosphatase [Phycisphaerales bacterium]|nr:tyrosine-protein phosphatase [Phycisphaerales bacterium]
MIGRIFLGHPKNFAVVVPGLLYRSGVVSPRSLRALHKRLGIKTIVDLGATTLLPAREAAIQAAANALGLDRYALRLKGTGEGDPNEYVHALRILARQDQGPILVHCAAGAQRTGACIIFFRHLIERKPLDEAFAEAQSFGYHPRKDAALHAYVMRWHTAIADAIANGHTIAYEGPTARQDNRTPIDQLPR